RAAPDPPVVGFGGSGFRLERSEVRGQRSGQFGVSSQNSGKSPDRAPEAVRQRLTDRPRSTHRRAKNLRPVGAWLIDPSPTHQPSPLHEPRANGSYAHWQLATHPFRASQHKMI